MKNLFLAFLFSLVLTASAHAAPVWGSTMPAAGRIHAGLQTHSVLDNKLEGVHGEDQSLRHFVELSYGLTDWLSIDLKAGTGNIRYYPDSGTKLVYNSGFAGGYGFRVKAFEKDKVAVVAGFQHISVHPQADFDGPVKYEAILDDWEANVIAGYRWARATPYAGIKAGRRDYTYWVDDHDRNRVKSDAGHVVGLVLGMDIAVREEVWINLEAQMIDTAAIAAGVRFEF